MKAFDTLMISALLAGTSLPAIAHLETAQATSQHLFGHLLEASLIGLGLVVLLLALRQLRNRR